METMTMKRPERKRAPRKGATRDETAAHFNVTTRTVHAWRAAGWLATHADGSVDLAATAERLAANRSPDHGGRADRGSLADRDMTLAEARRRKEVAVARLRELEAGVAEGRLIDADAAKRAWFSVVRALRNRIQQVATTAAPECIGRDVVTMEAIIRRHIDAALLEVSEDRPPEVRT
jgi:hypothetical protein